MQIEYATEESTGVCSRRHRGSRKHQTLHGLGRNREAGCLARRGLRCGGRGEAAGVNVYTGVPFRTAAIDQAVPGFPVPYEILPSPGFEAPVRFVGKNRTRSWSEEEDIHKGGRSTRCES